MQIQGIIGAIPHSEYKRRRAGWNPRRPEDRRPTMKECAVCLSICSARNSNAYRQPMVASVSSSAVGVSSITSAANTANTDGVSGVSTLDATIGRIHDIPQSAMSRLTGSPTVYAR